MPPSTMTSSNDEIDEQLAQDLENEAVTRLTENLAVKLRNSCERSDDQIGKAWDTIQTCMAEFRHSKEKMINTLVKVEGRDRTSRVLQRGLAEMVPQKYSEILAVARSTSDIAYPSPLTSPQMPIPNGNQSPTQRNSSAAASTPGLPRPMAVMNSPSPKSAPLNTDSTSGGYKFTMKRSANHLDHPYPVSKKKKVVQPPNREVDTWDVEGTDYIFPHSPFGPGWFVIRCHRGIELPVRFTKHPLKENLALDHFNSKRCKHHDSSRPYTEDEIMTKFGYRVRGDEVSDEWVSAANKRLEADTAKAALTGKGKLGRTGMA